MESLRRSTSLRTVSWPVHQLRLLTVLQGQMTDGATFWAWHCRSGNYLLRYLMAEGQSPKGAPKAHTP
ncbi:Hypothetical predicted protein [Pelobates cultripes]|uniref:Uncharacterized protein n=1 Tax=Pelobates cultripes TaxID=61616 RepID=A0AAD1RW93_PELCU|nr:Hypothetical predicted protein [Pelobates cultripes]